MDTKWYQIDVMQWATTRTLTRPPYAHGLVGGDFNCNPWSPAHPLAATHLVDLFREFCRRSETCRVNPVPDAPTWCSPAGVSTSIHHWLVYAPLLSGCRAEVPPFDGFPFDHCSVNLDLPQKLNLDPPVNSNRTYFALTGPHMADKRAEFAR